MNLREHRLVVFESNLRENYRPFSLTKPTFDLNLGAQTLLRKIESNLSCKVTDLFVPEYLEKLTKETHFEAAVNKNVASKCILINSLISHQSDVWKAIQRAAADDNQGTLFLDSARNTVFGFAERLSPEDAITGRSKAAFKPKPVPSEIDDHALMKYPWNIVERNAVAISEDYATGFKGSGMQSEKEIEVMGKRISISNKAEIERFVTLDSTKGPIIISDDVQVQSFSHLTGPCFIGRGSILKSAKIREGTSIGRNCHVSGEVEESIISDFSNKNHDGFIGHSIIGEWVNLGALTTNSDLKNTYGNIKVKVGKALVDTKSIKIGVFIGDMAKTAIGTLITSGKKVGASSNVFGVILEDVPSFTLFAESLGTESVEMYIDSAIETQKRMMERRGVRISASYVSMMKSVFRMTRRERMSQQVSRGKFRL